MKKFLIKFVAFLAFCAVAFFGAWSLYFVRLNTISFEVSVDNEFLFIGDSHMETGIDEAQIPGAYNFAQSGDPYFDQFFRLERILEDNPQFKTVFITATPHSLSKYGDARIFGNYTMQNVVPNALPLYNAQIWKMYLENEPVRFAKFLLCEPLRLAKRVLISSRFALMKRLGARRISEARNLEKSIEKERNPNATGRLHGDDSAGTARQIEYLRKMVEFARSRGARVVFLNLPLYRDEEFFDVPYFKNLLKTEFSDVEFWDYADFPIPDDCRQDINHLNRWGAEIFSRELADRMKREGMLPPQ